MCRREGPKTRRTHAEVREGGGVGTEAAANVVLS